MTESVKNIGSVSRAARLVGWWQDWLIPGLMRRNTFGAALVVSLLALLYWSVIASDRYVSEAHVVVQRTDFAGGSSAGSVSGLLGSLGSDSHADQFLLRDHLLSVDMLKKLDARLNLREHYSDSRRDLLSRMWLKGAELEWFHRHYRSRVDVEFDDSTGIVTIRAQGYDPKTAYLIATALVEEGERFMNGMAHGLAHEQVIFLEKQVAEMEQRAIKARQAVIIFQNNKGLVSPESTTQNFVAIVSRLESQLADLQTRHSAMLGYLMPDSPNIVDLNIQIAAVNKQIVREKARLTSSDNKTLNRTVEEYQRLQMSADFALEVYKTTLGALVQGRIEATRLLKKVSILQSPFEPQYPVEPRRAYNSVLFALVALLLAGVIHLLAAIIRDHKD